MVSSGTFQCGFMDAEMEQVGLKAKFRVMGGRKVFKKTQHKNCLMQRQQHDGAWDVRGMVRKSEPLASNSENPASLNGSQSTIVSAFSLTLLNCQVQWAITAPF